MGQLAPENGEVSLRPVVLGKLSMDVEDISKNGGVGARLTKANSGRSGLTSASVSGSVNCAAVCYTTYARSNGTPVGFEIAE